MDKTCLEGKNTNELLEICEGRDITGMDNQPNEILIQVILNDMVETAEVPTREDLELKSLTELRDLCDEREMAGLEKQPKSILIELLLNDYVEKAIEIMKVKADVTVEKTEGGTIDMTVTVSCGSSQDEFNNLVGQTVGDVAKFLANVMNIPDNPKCLVNGAEVNLEYVLQAKDQLDFVQRAEKKGNVSFLLILI